MLFQNLGPSTTGAIASAAPAGWLHQSTVTIPAATGSSTLTGIALYVQASDTKLKSVANGGTVQHTTTNNLGVTVPADFTLSSTACTSVTTVPNWNIYTWSATAGTMTIKIGETLTTGAAITLFGCVGNSTITTYQGSALCTEFDGNTVGYWAFGDGTSLNGQDSGCSGLNLTPTGSPIGTGGLVGGAVTSFSNSDYLTSPTISTVTGSVTVSMWTNIATATYQISFDGPLTGSGGDIALLPSFPTVPYFQYGTAFSIGSSSVTTGVWHHIVGTKDDSAGTIFLYYDGVQQPATFLSSYPMTTFLVGNNTALTAPLTGPADELQLDNTLRSPDWVTEIFQNQSTVPTFATFI